MGTILEFPQWRSQRSPPAGTKLAAQIVIFPGVRIERDDVVCNSFVPLPNPYQRGDQASDSIKP